MLLDSQGKQFHYVNYSRYYHLNHNRLLNWSSKLIPLDLSKESSDWIEEIRTPEDVELHEKAKKRTQKTFN